MNLIVQENHYYPFGMNLVGIEKEGMPEDRWQFMGVEKEERFDLNWSETNWRGYDWAKGRFEQIDGHTEDYDSWSPYHYSANNPILFNAPSGLDWHKNDETGAVVWVAGNNSTYETDGLVFNNIGESYTVTQEDGTQILYHQNEDGVIVDQIASDGEANLSEANTVIPIPLFAPKPLTINPMTFFWMTIGVGTLKWFVNPSPHGSYTTPGLDGSAAYRDLARIAEKKSFCI